MITVTSNWGQGLAINIVGALSVHHFQQMVQRATNLWPDAPAEIKEFADKITNNGKVQQRYEDQEHATTVTLKNHQCSCGYVTTCPVRGTEDPEYNIVCSGKVVLYGLEPETDPPQPPKFGVCGRNEKFRAYVPAHLKPGVEL